MSVFVNMMSPSKTTALAHRLERLTGEPALTCVPRYRSAGDELSRDPNFRATLSRLTALADRRRLTAVRLLEKRGELCACEIQAALGLSHPGVSYHMRILIRAGFAEGHRRGKWVYYRLTPRARDMLRWA